MKENLAWGGTPMLGAIIGFGNVAMHAHIPVWQKSEHFTIDAVVEPDAVRAQKARDVLPGVRIFKDLQSMIAENGVQFVDICTPPCFHDDLAVQACEAGLHVFCEKPLTTSVEGLRMIRDAAKGSGRVVFTVNNWKYAPIWIKAAEIIRDRQIGRVQSLRMEVLRTPGSGGGASDWRKRPEISGGGIMIDHGWHNLYLILSLIGDSPVSLSSYMESSSNNGPDFEETVDLTLRFREAEAHLYLTWKASCRRNSATVLGESGILAINDDHLIVHADGRPPKRYDFVEALSAGSHHPDWMDPVIENFAREITDERCRGANLQEAGWCTRLIDLAYRSSRKHSHHVDVCGTHIGEHQTVNSPQ